MALTVSNDGYDTHTSGREKILTGVSGAERKNDLTNVDTSDLAVGLTESTTHTGLQSIGTGARQHLVDTDNVVRVDADAHVETFFTSVLDHVPSEGRSEERWLDEGLRDGYRR